MDKYTATEQAYKHGYEKGYEAGKRDAVKWIPVTERLPHFTPNRWRKVLVTLEDKDGKRFTTTAKYNEESKEWGAFADWRFDDKEHFKVVAWMLKPEPMKEDE